MGFFPVLAFKFPFGLFSRFGFLNSLSGIFPVLLLNSLLAVFPVLNSLSPLFPVLLLNSLFCF